MDRVIVGDHRRQIQPPCDLAGQRRTDDAAGMADNERHLFRRRVHRGEDQIALVLAVVIVGDDDDLAGGERLDRLADTGLGQGRPLRGSRPATKPVGGKKFRVRQAQPIDSQPPQDSARVRLALRRILEIADAQVAGERRQQLRRTGSPPREGRRAGCARCGKRFKLPANGSLPSAGRPAASRSAIAMQLATSSASSWRSGGNSGSQIADQHVAGERQQCRASGQIIRRPASRPFPRGRISAVGRRRIGVVCTVEQHQNLELAFAGAPPGQREIEAALAAQHVAVALLQCDNRPAHARQHLPEMDPLRVDDGPLSLS